MLLVLGRPRPSGPRRWRCWPRSRPSWSARDRPGRSRTPASASAATACPNAVATSSSTAAKPEVRADRHPQRRPRLGRAGGGSGSECRSAGRSPPSTSSISSASATVRVSGPIETSVFQPGPDGSCGTNPNVGLCPTSPQNAAGMRIEPPPSPPSADRAGPGRHGRRRPARGATGGAGPVVRVAGGRRRWARWTRRCSRTPRSWSCRRSPRRRPAGAAPPTAVRRGTKSARARLPEVVGTPASHCESLTEIGRPSSGRAGAGREPALGLRGGPAGRSSSRTANGLTGPLISSARASTASSSSAAPISRPRSAADQLAGRGAQPRVPGRVGERHARQSAVGCGSGTARQNGEVDGAIRATSVAIAAACRRV